MKIFNIKYIFIFTTIVSLAGCAYKAKSTNAKPSKKSTIIVENVGEIDEILYVHSDPPVNPKYSETFTIHVQLDSMRLTLDSLKTTGFDKDRRITQKDVEQLREGFQKYKVNMIPKDKLIDNSTCIGGNGEELVLKLNNKVVFEGFTYNCAGILSGTMEGDLGDLFFELEKLAYQQ